MGLREEEPMTVVLWIVGGLVTFLTLAALGTLFSLERFTDESGATRARVSKSSWLGKYYDFVAGWIFSGYQWKNISIYPPRKLNFCQFFKRLVACSLVNAFVAGLVTFVLASMIAFPYFGFVYGWEIILAGSKEVVENFFAAFAYGQLWRQLVIFGVVFWAFGIITAIVAGGWKTCALLHERLKSSEPSTSSSVARQSALGMWMQAKKARICPTLEVVE